MVSVIIPTYGGGDGLEKVIRSILNQSYQNIEIIVVDDNGCGSENQQKTEAVLKQFIQQGQVQYLTPEKNGGGSVARNIGARASHGEYLMFLDDDDTVSADKIEKQVQALQANAGTCGIAYCSTKVFADGKFSNVVKAHESGDILYRYLMGKVYIGTGTALMIRQAWESIGGYDESFVRHQDWEFFARILNKYEAVAVPDAYFHRFITNRNLPKKLDVMERYADHYIAFLKQYEFRISASKVRRVINRNNSRIALLYLKAKDIRHFRKVLEKYDHWIRAYPAFIGFCFGVVTDKIMGKKT